MNMTQSSNQPYLKRCLKRPSWISLNCRQLVVLCRDASPSMSGQKAEDASQATFQLIRELAKPNNKDGFSVSVIDFAGSAKVKHELMSATDMVQTIRPISTSLLGGGTNITAGLELSHQQCKKTPDDGQTEVRWLRPVVILFSDGCHNRGPKPASVAKELGASADIVTVAYGSDADVALLTNLATTPQHHYQCQDGSELRKFLAAVGASMTASLASGTNATDALGSIKQLDSGRMLQ